MRLKTLAQQAYIGLANMGDGNYGAIGKAVDAASAIGYCKAAEIASNPRNQKAFFYTLAGISALSLIATACANAQAALTPSTTASPIVPTETLPFTPTATATATLTALPTSTITALPTSTQILNPLLHDPALSSPGLYPIHAVIAPPNDIHAVFDPLLNNEPIDSLGFIAKINQVGVQPIPTIAETTRNAGQILFRQVLSACPTKFNEIATAIGLKGAAGNAGNIDGTPVQLHTVGQTAGGVTLIDAGGAVPAAPFEALNSLNVDVNLEHVKVGIPDLNADKIKPFEMHPIGATSLQGAIIDPHTPTVTFNCAGTQVELIRGQSQGLDVWTQLLERLYKFVAPAGGGSNGDSIGDPNPGPIPPNPGPIPPNLGPISPTP